MRIYQLLVKTFLVITLSLCIDSSLFAQKNRLPSGLTENSSLEEVLGWLDKMALAQARVGLNAEVAGSGSVDAPTIGERYSEWAVFSQGFRLAKIDGCKITLRNNELKLISFSTLSPSPEGSLSYFRKAAHNQSPLVGELFIPLRKLKAKKAPYQHTNKAERARLLGTWRIEFKLKSVFSFFPKLKSQADNLPWINIIGAGHGGLDDSMGGNTVTFAFDDKQMSEDFYAAFSRAINLCKER
jgi:hypothetical protein